MAADGLPERRLDVSDKSDIPFSAYWAAGLDNLVPTTIHRGDSIDDSRSRKAELLNLRLWQPLAVDTSRSLEGLPSRKISFA